MTDVKPDPVSSESVSEDVKTQVQESENAEGASPSPAKAGDKTDPNLLLKSLREEREKRQELETRLQTLEETLNPSASPELEDEEIKALKTEIAEIRTRQQKSELIESYPQMKELWLDFEEFRQDPENKGMNVRTAAKAFLTEKGLLEPLRKGLEKPTGGPRIPATSGMSIEDIKHLRETNFKKYLEMVQKGMIKIG